MVDPGEHHTEEEVDDVDKRNMERLRSAGAKGKSGFQTVSNVLKAVIGLRHYASISPPARQMLGEMWNGNKTSERHKPPKPFPSFNSSGGHGFTLQKEKRGKR